MQIALKPKTQVAITTGIAAAILLVLSMQTSNPVSLWLTPDQQGRLAYENLEFSEAADLFQDPAWKGVAAFEAGRYIEAADAFGRIPTAVGFYNRGNAFLKGREYVKVIAAYEQAVAEDPEWTEAVENLELSKYILDYLESTREQSSTGEQGLGADDVKYDKQAEGGEETVITKESTIEMASAEKWMRGVDTETSDFLRTRFELEARQRDAL